MPALRVRFLAVLGVVVAGAAGVFWLDSAPARAVVVLVVAAAARSGSGASRRGPRPPADESRESTADERDQAADRRDQVADQRDQVAGQRDQAAGAWDQVATAQDQAAGRRDLAAEQRDLAGEQRDLVAGQPEGSAPYDTGRRDRSAMARQAAAADRIQASQDRGAGASRRERAGLDRESALADREAGAGERAHAELDREQALADRAAPATRDGVPEPTGLDSEARADLSREIERATGTGEPLVVAFVGLDLGDSRGGGERLLAEVASGLRTGLRSYDLVVRYGGDLVCALPGLGLADAAQRFALIDAALAPESGVTVGLAELRPGESVDDLVARAHAARQVGEIR